MLNGITLGQREIDSNCQMMLISKLMSTFIRFEKRNLGLVNLAKFDPINRLIPLSVTQLSGTRFNPNTYESFKDLLVRCI